MTRRSRQAFTLIEILVVSGVFLMLVWMGFGVFDFGSRACGVSNLRSNLQSGAARVILSLENDLRRSNYSSITMISRSVTFSGQTYRRDAICLVGVANWADPASFNTQFGFPNFDRYIIYYATTNAEGGRLIRSLVNTTADPLGGTQSFLGITEKANFNNDPSLNVAPTASDPGQLAYTLLSDDVRNFVVSDGSTVQSIKASLTLFREGVLSPTGGQKRVDQSFQMDIDLSPQNTYPRSAN